jgi:RNA polymerase sigma factor (sigma-70 family)
VPGNTQSDAELVARAQAGEQAALEDLWERHAEALRRVGRSAFGNGWLAQEVAQEAWEQVLRHVGDLREPSAFGAWAVAIARRWCDRRARARSADGIALGTEWWESMADPGPSVADDAIARVEVDRVLSLLPPTWRGVVELCLVDGLSPAEAAERLSVTATVVKGRLQRARATLRRELDPMARVSTKREPKERKQTVAIVDDERHIVRFIAVNMEAAGYATVAEYDGVAGLELVRAKRPDLLVLDLLMPHMYGWTVLRHLRADPEFMDLPVIVLTALPGDDPRAAICHELAQVYMRKPFNPFVLIERVRGILGIPPKVKQALARVRALRFDETGDPMELVPLFREGDPQVRAEVQRALGERSEAALEALRALRDPWVVLSLGTPTAWKAVDGWLEDADPAMRLATLAAIENYNRPSRATVVSYAFVPEEQTRGIIEGAVEALAGLEHAEREAILRNLRIIGSERAREALAQVRDKDLHGLGALAGELLEG